MKIYYPGGGKIQEHESMIQKFPDHYQQGFKITLCFHHRVYEIDDDPRVSFYEKIRASYICLNCGLRAFNLEDYLDV